MDIIKDIKNKRQSKKKNNIRDSSFDMNKIVKGFLPELMSSEKNNIIDENYVYFPNLFLGEGCYGAVVFGAKLDDYTSIGIKVQKKTNIKDELKIEYNILKILLKTSPLPKVFITKCIMKEIYLLNLYRGQHLKNYLIFALFILI